MLRPRVTIETGGAFRLPFRKDLRSLWCQSRSYFLTKFFRTKHLPDSSTTTPHQFMVLTSSILPNKRRQIFIWQVSKRVSFQKKDTSLAPSSTNPISTHPYLSQCLVFLFSLWILSEDRVSRKLTVMKNTGSLPWVALPDRTLFPAYSCFKTNFLDVSLIWTILAYFLLIFSNKKDQVRLNRKLIKRAHCTAAQRRVGSLPAAITASVSPITCNDGVSNFAESS